jgi:transposase
MVHLRLFYFDESGFAPSLPTNASWCLPGQRKWVPYEYPSGRRVNALAAYEPLATEPWLGSCALERTLTSADVLAYWRALPAATVPRVVVLDNAGIHTSKEIKAERPALCREGLYLYYLPAYSPELNDIEPVFKQIKHHDMPVRSHTSKAELRSSVEGGFATRAQCLRKKSNKSPRLAA